MKVTHNPDATITVVMDRDEAERIRKMLSYSGYGINKSIEFGDGDRDELRSLRAESIEFHRLLYVAIELAKKI
jgi:hypothetical protein